LLDDLLGEVVLSLADYFDGSMHDKWFQLQKEPKKKKESDPAEIHLKIFATGSIDTPIKSKKEKKEKLEKKDKKERKEQSKEKVGKKQATKEKKELSIEDKYEMGKIIGR
jgi:hypothetical protein